MRRSGRLVTIGFTALLSISAMTIAVANGATATTRPAGKSVPCDRRAPVRATQSGKVCGTVQRRDGREVSAYLGVPYAAPPVGALRWAAPRPPRPWHGVRRASTYARLCAQPYGSPTLTGFKGSENCLYLNVWTPQAKSAAPRAVLVYVPGGGFLVGGGSLTPYSGAYLAASSNVVVVTINYRLGALGFLRYTGHRSGIAGNFGILDQDAALEWVHKNIAAFGGDPAKVTLWGESAGAVSTALHLFSIPAGNGTFRAAIMDSNVDGPLLPDAAQAAQSGAGFVHLLCQYQTTATCPETAGWLRSLPLQTIMTAENSQLSAEGIHGLFLNTSPITFGPTVGVKPITGQPLQGYHPGVRPKPFVMGHNQDEGGFFTPQPPWMTASQYTAFLTSSFTTAGADAILSYRVAGRRPYNPATYRYRPRAQMTPAAQAYMRVITDAFVAAPNLLLTQEVRQRIAAAGLPMFGYEFSEVANFNYQGLPQCSPASGNVCHSYELPFAFNNLSRIEGTNTNEWYAPVRGTAQERQLSRTMAGAWAGFAKNPTAAGWGYQGISDPATGPYAQFGQDVGVINNVSARANYSLWKPILDAEIAAAER
jgi:carboxylesterase type B